MVSSCCSIGLWQSEPKQPVPKIVCYWLVIGRSKARCGLIPNSLICTKTIHYLQSEDLLQAVQVKESMEKGICILINPRLPINVFGTSQTCPNDFFKNQYSGFLQVQVTEWANGFLWIILGLCLLIESSLVHLQHAHISHLRAKHASNGSCCCWKFLRHFARPDAHWLQYTGRFSSCGTALQGHTKGCWKKVFQFVSVCL